MDRKPDVEIAKSDCIVYRVLWHKFFWRQAAPKALVWISVNFALRYHTLELRKAYGMNKLILQLI